MFARKEPLAAAMLVIASVIIAGMDLIEVIPIFDPFTGSGVFHILHESHDIVALLVGLWAAYRWDPLLGYFFLLLFLAMHLPYVTLTWSLEPAEHIRLLVTMATALIGVRLLAELRSLHDHQENIAHVLQEALLVMPKYVDGVDFAHTYQSATAATRVGGDFYDIFEIADGRFGVMIGDISGKGISAATMTSGVKNTVRSFAMSGGSPQKVMERANRAVSGLFPQGLFVTLFFGILEPETGTLEYSSAGHPPPMIRSASGQITLLTEHNALMGAFAETGFHDTRVKLSRGDILVMYTDGVVEAPSLSAERFGTDRLVTTLSRATSSASPQGMVNRVLGELHAFTDGELSDDTAILALSLDSRSGPLLNG